MSVTIVDANARDLDCIVLNRVENHLVLPPDLYDAYGRKLEEGRQRFLAEESMGNVHSGNIAGLVNVTEEPDRLVFRTKLFPFRDYYALRHFAHGVIQTGASVDTRLLGAQAALSMITVVETSDNHLVFCHRQGDHLANRYLSPSGFYPFDGPADKEFIRRVIFRKLSESLNVESFAPVQYIGACHDDRDSFLFVHVLLQRLPHSAQEVYRMWNALPPEKRKHDHLLFVANELKPIVDYMFHAGEHTFNYYTEPQIKFKGKKMVSGPKEHAGKEYEHIENGVGSMLLYIAHRFGSTAAASLCGDLVSEKIISNIDAEPLRTGSLHKEFLQHMGVYRK